MSWRTLGLVLVAAGAGCADGTGPGAPGPLSGRWTAPAFRFPLDVTFEHADTTVIGSGTMAATPTRVMRVIGHVSSSATAPHKIILTFSGVNTTPAIYFANLSADQDTLTGDYRWTSGLAAEPAVFIRQR